MAPSLSKAIANVTADNVACNLARLAHRMTGDHLLAIATESTGKSAARAAAAAAVPASFLNATVSISANGTVRMLLFHHHPWYNATSVPTITPAEVKVTVCGFEKSYGPGPSSVGGGTMWKLDDLNGQFWPTWEDDLVMANVNTSVPGDSWVQDGGKETLFSDPVHAQSYPCLPQATPGSGQRREIETKTFLQVGHGTSIRARKPIMCGWHM